MRWKDKDNSKWHRWFAWHPVVCKYHGTNVWLETVWRREIYRGIDSHEYAVFEERPDIIEDDVTPKGFL